MKKVVYVLIFGILFFAGFGVNAQPGSSCSNPYAIAALPFQQSGMSTTGFPDIFDNTDACTSNFMTGNDFIFSYTAIFDQYVDISLTNTGNAVGLFVVEGCPDQAGAVCIASSEAYTGNPSLTNVALTAGTTYFIVVSTMDPIIIIPNPSTNFNIEMVMQNPYDIAVIKLLNPITGCSLSDTEDVTIRLINNGMAAADSFAVAYKLDNNTAVHQMVYQTIVPGDSLDFTFNATADLSIPSTIYHLVCWSELPDGNPGNDTLVSDIAHLQSISIFPYFQDFENGNGNFAGGGSNSSWAWGQPSKPVINHSASPVKCWVTSLTGNYNQGEASWLQFPCLDFSSLSAPVIEFDIWVATSGLLDYARVEYSKNGGQTWQILGQMNDPLNWYDGANGWSSSTGGWMHVRYRIDSLAGNNNGRMRIYFSGSLILQSEGIAIDNIRIYQASPHDLGVSQITHPVTTCGLGANEYPEIIITNYGTQPESNFPVRFSLNGVLSPAEIVAGPLNPGASMAYIFTNPANFSAVQQYHLQAFTQLAADGDLSNDTSHAMINNMLGVSVFPYNENFENGDGGWVGGGLNTSWAWGQPQKPAINHAASPTHCWATNLTASANMMEMSQLTGPCFDFSTLTMPEIEFNIWYSTSTMGAGMDSITLEVSIDSGATWTRVGAMGQGFNWYNTPNGWSGNSGGWVHVRHTLPGTGGEENVRLRIRYFGPMSMMVDGVAIDDINIHETPGNDMGVLSLLSPVSSCNLTSQEIVTVQFTNYGQNTQNHFYLKYQINNGPWRTDSILFDVYQGDVLFHMFSQTADLSAPGIYTIKATTSIANDENHANDTVTAMVSNIAAINTLPYTQDFEGGNGDFYTNGNSSWAWGNPTSTIINTAHSPTKAWKTNLSGAALQGENSYLYSPCMDLSSYSNPWIELWIWHEITMMMGSGTLEASIDGGFNWFVVGLADTNQWYTASFFPVPGNEGWSGSSAGWKLKRHALDNCGNQSAVKLRFHIQPGTMPMPVANEGIAIDDIHIFDCVMPDASFTYSGSGNSISFSNTSTNATHYLWKFGDGGTATTTNSSHNYAAPGAYVVTLIAYSDCGPDSVSQTVNITGIGDYGAPVDLQCIPNPSQGKFNIIASWENDPKVLIEVMTLQGHVVLIQAGYAQNRRLSEWIDLGSVSRGVYTLRLTSEHAIVIRKIVVE